MQTCGKVYGKGLSKYRLQRKKHGLPMSAISGKIGTKNLQFMKHYILC